MTACRNIQEIISAYLEGAVSPDQERLVAEHLASCQKCRAVLQDLKETAELVKGLEEVEPPPWLASRIMAHVREEAEKEVGFFRRLFYPLRVKIPLQAFATVLIVGLAFYVYKSAGPEVEQAREPARPEQALPQKAAPARSAESLPAPKAGPPAGRARDEGGAAAIAPSPGRESSGAGREGDEKALLLRSAERPEGLVKEEKMREAEAAPAPSGSKRDAKAAAVSLTLRVVDVRSATAEVEELFRQTGARNVTREPHEGSESVTGVVQREKARALVEKLTDIGDAEPSRPELPAGAIAVRVTIVLTPSGSPAYR